MRSTTSQTSAAMATNVATVAQTHSRSIIQPSASGQGRIQIRTRRPIVAPLVAVTIGDAAVDGLLPFFATMPGPHAVVR
jgi:hypothetical protein